jgi:hypothetical protein
MHPIVSVFSEQKQLHACTHACMHARRRRHCQMSYVAEGVLPLLLQSQASMSLVGSIILLLAGRASQVQFSDSLDGL